MTETAWPPTQERHLVAVEDNGPPVGVTGRFLTFEDLSNLPDVEPLVEDTIPLGGVSLLAGQYGTAKSFMALSMACSVASGTPWHGRLTRKKKTLYVAAEGHFGLRKRLGAWQEDIGATIGDDLVIFSEAIQLGNPEHVGWLASQVNSQRYGFVIIDTLAKSMVGLEENSNSDMGRAIDSLYKLRNATQGGSVLVVHHTGKSGETIRGASALEAGVDVVYLATAKNGEFTIDRKKNKDGPVSDSRTFRLVDVPGHSAPVLDVKDSIDIDGKSGEFMSAMSELCQPGGRVVQSQLRKKLEWSSGTFTNVRDRVLKSGLVIKEDSGKDIILYKKEDEPF